MMIHNRQSFPGDDNVCYVWHHFCIRLVACILKYEINTQRTHKRERERGRGKHTFVLYLVSKVWTDDYDVNGMDWKERTIQRQITECTHIHTAHKIQ